jgi:hypothetical protein
MAKFVYFGHYWFPGGRGNAYVTFDHPIETDADVWEFKRRLAQIVGKPELLLVSYQILDTDADNYLLPSSGECEYVYFISYYYQNLNSF